jgi:hypothetical protein
MLASGLMFSRVIDECPGAHEDTFSRQGGPILTLLLPRNVGLLAYAGSSSFKEETEAAKPLSFGAEAEQKGKGPHHVRRPSLWPPLSPQCLHSLPNNKHPLEILPSYAKSIKMFRSIFRSFNCIFLRQIQDLYFQSYPGFW